MTRIGPKDQVLLDLASRIRNLEDGQAYRHFKALQTFRTSHFVFKENFSVLRRRCDDFFRLDESILNENSIIRWRRQRLIVVGIHNLLTSGDAFFDHVRSLTQQKLIAIDSDPLYRFVHALRNYIVHRQAIGLKSVTTSYKRDNDFLTQSYHSLDTVNFRAYLIAEIEKDGKRPNRTHNKVALAYLQSCKILDLDRVLSDYAELLRNYYSNVLHKYVKANEETLTQFVKEVSEIRKLAVDHGCSKDYPISESQQRYLQLLLRVSR